MTNVVILLHQKLINYHEVGPLKQGLYVGNTPSINIP